MQPRQVVQSYIDAWNSHDGDAVIATFADGGSYSDPMTGQGLTGQAIANYAKSLWAAFPDLSFEVVNATEAGDGMIAMQWLMGGTFVAKRFVLRLEPQQFSLLMEGLMLISGAAMLWAAAS